MRSMPLPRPRPARLATAVAGLLLACVVLVAGCSRSDAPPTTASASTSGIQVTGAFGTAPQVSYPIPWTDTTTTTKVLVEGKGSRLRDGAAVLLEIYAQDGSTGKVLRDDFTGIASPYLLTEDGLGGDLYAAVVGRKVGSRLLHTVVSDGVPVVMTVDILPTSAQGAPVEHLATETSDGAPMPTVKVGKDGVPVVTVDSDAKPPAALTAVALRRGDGEQVRAGRTAVLRYVAVRWSTGKVSGSTWAAGALPVTVTIGADELIEGLDDALTEVAAGSRILVVVPPDKGFAPAGGKLKDETLVYLVDVLAVQGTGE